MNTTLKPCAHCGNKDIRLMRTITRDCIPSWHAECPECGIRTGEFTEDCDYSSDYATVLSCVDEAIYCCIRTWNARADDECCNCKYCDCDDEHSHRCNKPCHDDDKAMDEIDADDSDDFNDSDNDTPDYLDYLGLVKKRIDNFCNFLQSIRNDKSGDEQ